MYNAFLGFLPMKPSAFNGRFQRCLNETGFCPRRMPMKGWKRGEITIMERAHGAFGNLYPREFAVLAEIAD